MTRHGLKLALLIVGMATVGCDQVSKHVASTLLAGAATQSFLGDTLRLEYAENAGAFLSLGAQLPAWARTALFSVGTSILLIACGISILRRRLSRIGLLGWCLVLAGGASNLIDRVVHGQVVDFLNVGIGRLRTGIFNVADVAIMLGVGLLVLQSTGRVDETRREDRDTSTKCRE